MIKLLNNINALAGYSLAFHFNSSGNNMPNSFQRLYAWITAHDYAHSMLSSLNTRNNRRSQVQS